MSETVHIAFYDEVFLQVKASKSILMELSEVFVFEVPNARYDRRVKYGIWDGKIRLLNKRTGLLYKGLHQQLIKEIVDMGYKYTSELEIVPTKIDVTLEKIKAKIKNLPFDPEDYQVNAVQNVFDSLGRTLLVSPTGSGKSFIMYITSLLLKQRTLIVVPTTSLVHQMQKDFYAYGYNKTIQIILGGKTKDVTCDICVSTWQSVYKQDQEWFDQFGLILGDEAHTFKATSLKTLMEKTVNVKFKIGTTGTLPEEIPNLMVLTGLFGPPFVVERTKNLMDRGILTKLDYINVIQLEYDKEIRKRVNKLQYQDQVKYIISNNNRNKFIVNLSLKTKGNTLVLYKLVDEHGKIIYNMINEKVHNKQIFLVFGDTDAEIREKIREISEVNSNVIIVASYATFSTGINIKNLSNIIFAAPMKSREKVLQSIGRGTRLHESKDSFNVFDIADNFTYDTKINVFMLHLIERIKYYVSENFRYKITKVKI